MLQSDIAAGPTYQVQIYRTGQCRIIGKIDDEAQCWPVLQIARQTADLIVPGHDPLVLERFPNGVIA